MGPSTAIQDWELERVMVMCYIVAAIQGIIDICI